MPYEPEKDEILKQWRCEETGLMVSIQRYAGGEAKLQIGPRLLKRKDGSDRTPAKAGRLTMEDLLWLYDIIDEIKDEMSHLAGPG
ncbi:MAG: hypothetical protein M0036_18115 [Desulfobacteraceae bacterium]|nr:hypothetical protein [Desulfobacteraceae bacterium]